MVLLTLKCSPVMVMSGAAVRFTAASSTSRFQKKISSRRCKRVGGGRVAALEILVSDTGIASLIRDGKTHMIMSAMQTGKARGNMLLNEELTRLVNAKIVKADEAMNKAVDKPDLAKKLGIELGPMQAAPAAKPAK